MNDQGVKKPKESKMMPGYTPVTLADSDSKLAGRHGLRRPWGASMIRGSRLVLDEVIARACSMTKDSPVTASSATMSYCGEKAGERMTYTSVWYTTFRRGLGHPTSLQSAGPK